ncbi:MAG: aldo/keto reductase [Candidatus Parvarchaeota archaeon]
MEFKEFDKTGRKISILGVGTWQLSQDKAENIRSIQYAISRGINFIDTAEIYGTEPIVGEAISSFDREKLFIASKVWPTHFDHDSLIKACEDSLSRLHTDYIDLYQLHWPNRSVPISETMAAMEELADDGKIRYIGVSNFSLDELKEAQKVMRKHEIVSNQVEYNIVTRDIETSGMFDYCKANDTAIIAYSPLSHGKIFGNKSLLDDLAKVGRKYKASAAQIALAWLLSRDNTFPIPKASSSKHMEENIASVNIKLKEEDISFLSSLEGKYHTESIAEGHKKRKDRINDYDFKEEKVD